MPRRLLRHAPVLVLMLAMAVQAAVALWLARDSWFGVDAVHYLTRRGPVSDENLGLIKPYGGHWQLIPIIVYRLLFATVGMSSYLPYVAVALAVHLVIVGMIGRLLVDVGANRWLAVTVALLVLTFGAGCEVFMWDAPVVLTTALLFGLVACLVVLRTEVSLRGGIAVSLLLTAGILCSGTGLTGLVLVGVLVLCRRGVVVAGLVTVPPALLFLVWFLAVGRDGRVGMSGGSLTQIPRFVWSGVTAAVGGLLDIPGTAGVLFVVVVAATVLGRGVPDRWRHLAWAGIAAAVTQLVLSSFASAAFGAGAAQVGRYRYIALVALAPAIALAGELLRRAIVSTADGPWARRAPAVVAVVVVVAATWQGLAPERTQRLMGRASAERYRTWVFGGVAAADAGERQLITVADYAFDGGDFTLFARPGLRSMLPDPPDADPRQLRLDTEAEYFVGVSGASYNMFAPSDVETDGFLLPSGDTHRAGCYTYRAFRPGATLKVATGRGVEVGVNGPATRITTQLTRDGLTSTPRQWPVWQAGWHVATTARDATLTITVDAPGDYSICHA